MDYTDLARVKSAMDSQETTSDTVLSDYITRASRAIDLLITGMPGVADYFLEEDIIDEVLTNGVVDFAGRLTVWPHKPIISAVTALSYRSSLRDSYKDADINYISTEYESVVYEGSIPYAEKMFVKISYTGGMAEEEDDLPKDLIDLATLMSVRGYKEARSGVGDSIGVAELGTLVYTKAYPVRAVEVIRHYARLAPWT